MAAVQWRSNEGSASALSMHPFFSSTQITGGRLKSVAKPQDVKEEPRNGQASEGTALLPHSNPGEQQDVSVNTESTVPNQLPIDLRVTPLGGRRDSLPINALIDADGVIVDVDANHLRRKRRKLESPDIELGSDDQSKTESGGPNVASTTRNSEAKTKAQEGDVNCEEVSESEVEHASHDRLVQQPEHPVCLKGQISKATHMSLGNDDRQRRLGLEAEPVTASLPVPDKDMLQGPFGSMADRSSPQRMEERSPSPKPSCPDKMMNEISSSRSTKPKRRMIISNGKLVQTMEAVVRYGNSEQSREHIGRRIEQILATSNTLPNNHAHSRETSSTVKIHPLFAGKEAARAADERMSVNDNSKLSSVVDWKKLKFSSIRSSPGRFVDLVRPLWPPAHMIHAGNLPRMAPSQQATMDVKSQPKLKCNMIQVPVDHNVLQAFAKDLRARRLECGITIPTRRVTEGNEIAEDLFHGRACMVPSMALSELSKKIKYETSAFDRGEAAGQLLWPIKYAPRGHKEVLQTSCGTLHDWLQSLAVHHVKTNLESITTRKRGRPKKKKTRKMEAELDDFIVDSDEENGDSTCTTKNAILIHGPPGCGKTASVYAVAKELGFEVFEIHPGMRRSARDIFDKVGDMTQNHLVQRGDANEHISRSSSVGRIDSDAVPPDPSGLPPAYTDKNQPTVANLFAARQGSKIPRQTSLEPGVAKKEQKQSLILIEEADILFDEDKGFWTGVQSLISQSKRPVVITCNDITTIPVIELDLHTILQYSAPDNTTATEYMAYIAAIEGHIVARQALTALYLAKKCDLRASLTELNFWCQMTVGSQQGGLDWMGHLIKPPSTAEPCQRLRIFSDGTYHTGLDLMPEILPEEDQYFFSQNLLDIPPTLYLDHVSDGVDHVREHRPMCNSELNSLTQWYDARSALDVLNPGVAPHFASVATGLSHRQLPQSSQRLREGISRLFISQLGQQTLRPTDLLDALQPLQNEKPTFPPAQGRLAPSLDKYSPSVATDIAPYVRAIVYYDINLERHWDEVLASQSRSQSSQEQGRRVRTTRASRAAAEGGDKSNTRTERWLPKDLNFSRVLQSRGSYWPVFEGYAGGEPYRELSSSPLSG